MKRQLSVPLAAAILAVLAILAGCASPASRESMAPPAIAVAKKHPYGVTGEARGGAKTGVTDSSNISDEDLKAALETAIVRSGLFRSVVQGKGGEYELTVTLVQLSKPLMGASLTVHMEVGWVLMKASDKTVVMRRGITSSHTTPWSEAFAGMTRLRLAVEGAARGNIAQGMQAIAELDL